MLRLARAQRCAWRPLLQARSFASAPRDGGSGGRRNGGSEGASGSRDMDYGEFFKGPVKNRRPPRGRRKESEDNFRAERRRDVQFSSPPPPPRATAATGGLSDSVSYEAARRSRRRARKEEEDADFLKRFIDGAGGAENATDPDFVVRFLGDEVAKDREKRKALRRGKKDEDKRDMKRQAQPQRKTTGPARFLESQDEGFGRGRDRETSKYEQEEAMSEEDEDEEEEGVERRKKKKSTSIYAGKIFEHDDHTLRRGYIKRFQQKVESEESDQEGVDEQISEQESSGDSEDDEEIDEDEFEEVMQKLHREYPAECQELESNSEAMEDLREDFPRLMRELREEEEEEEEEEKMQQGVIPRILLPTEKEEMWRLHKEDPKTYTVEKLAEKYRIRKARAHAILWLWELRKEGGGEVKSPEQEDAELRHSLGFDSDGEDVDVLDVNLQAEDRWETMWGTKPNYKIMPEDWEGSVRTEKEVIDEVSRKEEEMMLKEFEQRMEFNKLQIAGFIKNHLYSRRRPVDGWSYIVEEMGAHNRRGKHGGGYRFVANSDGTHRPLNELEKIFLRRESVRPRRRIV